MQPTDPAPQGSAATPHPAEAGDKAHTAQPIDLSIYAEEKAL
jgi:hypothetical protein